MKRNPDGTWRNTRRPILASPEFLRSEWIKAEALRLKTMGLSFDQIAEQITQVGQGTRAGDGHRIPAGVVFPRTTQSADKPFTRRLGRRSHSNPRWNWVNYASWITPGRKRCI